MSKWWQEDISVIETPTPRPLLAATIRITSWEGILNSRHVSLTEYLTAKCQKYHDYLRNFDCREFWTFIGIKKQKLYVIRSQLSKEIWYDKARLIITVQKKDNSWKIASDIWMDTHCSWSVFDILSSIWNNHGIAFCYPLSHRYSNGIL